MFSGGVIHAQAYKFVTWWALIQPIMQLYREKIGTKLVTEIFRI
jgi:hypothetical protein